MNPASFSSIVISPVGLTGVAISLLALFIACNKSTIYKAVIFVLLLVFHLSASLYYFQYSQTNVADASGYYFQVAGQPFSLGTMAVVKFVEILRTKFNATYFDCFIFFQSFGYCGLLILARVFSEIESNVGVPEQRGYLGLLFLPSVNFWTAAIGKDALMFFAIALCVWAIMNLRRRLLFFVISLGVMVLFRAHIALMAATALAGAALFGSDISLGRKLGLLSISLVGIWSTIDAVQSTIDVDVTSTASVTEFFDKSNKIYSTVAGSTSTGSASFPLRVVSLLFRPLFFDAHGLMGILASLENVGFLAAIYYTVLHWRDFAQLLRRVFFFRVVALFALILLFSLTLIYYNVGLGLRERVMAYPMMFSIFVAMWSVRRKLTTLAIPPTARGLTVHSDRFAKSQNPEAGSAC